MGLHVGLRAYADLAGFAKSECLCKPPQSTRVWTIQTPKECRNEGHHSGAVSEGVGVPLKLLIRLDVSSLRQVCSVNQSKIRRGLMATPFRVLIMFSFVIYLVSDMPRTYEAFMWTAAR